MTENKALAEKVDYAFSEYVPEDEFLSPSGVRYSISRGGFDEQGCQFLLGHMPPSVDLSDEERGFLGGIAGFVKWEAELKGQDGYLFFEDKDELERYWAQVKTR